MKKAWMVLLVSALLALLWTPGLFAAWENDQILTSANTSESNGAWCIADVLNKVYVVGVDPNGNIKVLRSTNYGQANSWTLRTSPGPGLNPSVVVAAGDTLHIAYQNNTDGKIYYQRSTDGGGTWGLPQMVSSSAGCNPSMCVAGANVSVLWNLQPPDGGICYRRSTNSGSTWVLSIKNVSSWGAHPSVASFGGGQIVHVAWDGTPPDGDGVHVWYSRSTDYGQTFSAGVAKDLDAATSPNIKYRGGYVHLVWESQPGTGIPTQIIYRRSTNDGVIWQSPVALTNSTTLYNIQPNLAVSGSRVHLVWIRHTLGYGDAIPQPNWVFHRSTTDPSGSSWNLEELVSTSPADVYQYYPPSVGVVTGGRVDAVWTNYSPSLIYNRDPTGDQVVGPPPPSGPGNGSTWLADSLSASGVEEKTPVTSQVLTGSLKAFPNPFVSSASVPGREAERFALYDVSGRQVGTYLGSRIGADVRPGIYFLKLEGKNTAPLRIVKVK